MGEFLLTRLLRGVTFVDDILAEYAGISTHTPLARRDKKALQDAVYNSISTHTPLARRDNDGR